jgi:hypothetical protein
MDADGGDDCTQLGQIRLYSARDDDGTAPNLETDDQAREGLDSGSSSTKTSNPVPREEDCVNCPKDWQEQDPKDWKPKHEYGGNRTPIRLEVFMHALSATSEDESIEKGKDKEQQHYGDYKHAHKLDKSDARWLHAKEVDMVKVVLCRFIKSQLTGLSLINAFRNAQDVKEPPGLRKANVMAKNIVKALSKGLHDGCDGSASTCTFGFVLQKCWTTRRQRSGSWRRCSTTSMPALLSAHQ